MLCPKCKGPLCLAKENLTGAELVKNKDSIVGDDKILIPENYSFGLVYSVDEKEYISCIMCGTEYPMHKEHDNYIVKA